MKFSKKISFFIILIFFSKFTIFSAQPHSGELHGVELCNTIFTYLQQNEIQCSPLYLVADGDNELPYSILINNNIDYTTDIKENDRLIFIFKIDEILEYINILINLQNKLQNENINSSILLIYDGIKKYPQFHLINSTEVYLENLDANDNNIIYNVRLNQKENKIISGTKGYASPAWMVQQVYKSFSDSNMDFNFPWFYISQMSKSSFDSDEILFPLLQNDLSAITVSFAQSLSEDMEKQFSNALEYLVNNFQRTKNSENDYHSLMISFGKNSFWISESLIIKIIIFIIILNLSFIFIIGYINFQQKNEAWIQLKKSWYILLVISIISILGFLCGKGLYLLFNKDPASNSSVYGILVLQFTITMILLSGYFFLEMLLHKQRYSGKSIDLLTLLITFLNQFIFCFVDISLFPIFFSICIFAVLSWLFNKNTGHIILFVLLFWILFTYIWVLVQNSNPYTLKLFLMTSKSLPFILPLIILPIFTMWFRILTAIRTKFETVKVSGILIASFCGFIILIVLIFNGIINSKYKITTTELKLSTKEDSENLYSLNYKDKFIFGELIRTISIDSEKSPELIQLTIEGEESVPVLYSNQDYSLLSNKCAVVDIPSYPGKTFNFSYGSEGNKELITLKMIFVDDDTLDNFMIEETLETEVLNDRK